MKKRLLPIAMLAGLAGGHDPIVRRNQSVAQFTVKSGKDKNSGGNRVSQKKRRIINRRKGHA